MQDATETMLNVDGRPFKCPANVVRGSVEVLQGIYGCEPYFMGQLKPKVALDIGANVGAYSIWARTMWPGARIHAYEPHPNNYSYVLENTDRARVAAEQVAVVGKALSSPTVLLREGQHNCGERSIYDIGEQESMGVEVPWVLASSLPDADAIKMDTEGCEVEILYAYLNSHRNTLQYVAYEHHRPSDAQLLADKCLDAGLTCVKSLLQHPERGVQVWVKI